MNFSLLPVQIILLLDCVPLPDEHVAVFNHKAIEFYKKFGFKKNGVMFTEERHRMPSGAIMPEIELIRAPIA